MYKFRDLYPIGYALQIGATASGPGDPGRTKHRPATEIEETNMCYPVRCPHCGKTTWDGCGQHVDEVKASIPPAQWCTCQRGSGNTGGRR